MAGTFSYAGTAAAAITTARDKVRLEIGDTDSTAVLFYDEEIDVYLGNRGSAVLATSADLCDVAASRFARSYDMETDGQVFKRSQMATMWRERAKDLRNRASGISTLVATRIDGFSTDIDADDVDESALNPRRRYYGDPDRIP